MFIVFLDRSVDSTWKEGADVFFSYFPIVSCSIEPLPCPAYTDIFTMFPASLCVARFDMVFVMRTCVCVMCITF